MSNRRHIKLPKFSLESALSYTIGDYRNKEELYLRRPTKNFPKGECFSCIPDPISPIGPRREGGEENSMKNTNH